MVLALVLGAALSARTMVMEHTSSVSEHAVRSVWRSIKNNRFHDDIRNVTPAQGYTFIRPDGTSCFDVSKDESRSEKA